MVGASAAVFEPLLLHAVPVPNGDGLVFQALEIHGDTPWRSDFVLSPIQFSDGARVVVDRAYAARCSRV